MKNSLTKKLVISGVCLITGLGITGCSKKPIKECTFSGTYILQSFGQELDFNYQQRNGKYVKISFEDGERHYTFFDKNGNNAIDGQGEYIKIKGPDYSGTITPNGTKTTGNFPAHILSKNDQEDIEKASTTLEIMRHIATEKEKEANPRYQENQTTETTAEQRPSFGRRLIDTLTTPIKERKIKKQLENFTHTGKTRWTTATYTKKGEIREISYNANDFTYTLRDTNNDGIVPNSRGDFFKAEKNGEVSTYTMDHMPRDFPGKWTLGIFGLKEQRTKSIKQKASEFFQEATEELTEEYKESLK